MGGPRIGGQSFLLSLFFYFSAHMRFYNPMILYVSSSLHHAIQKQLSRRFLRVCPSLKKYENLKCSQILNLSAFDNKVSTMFSHRNGTMERDFLPRAKT